jgi:protein phosphatase
MRNEDTLKLDNVKSENRSTNSSVCFGATDVGKIRENNEDNYVILEKKGKWILAVFDGMGGLQRGEIASSIIKNTLLEIAEGEDKWENYEFIQRIFDEANIRIYEYSVSLDLKGKIGTTGTIAIISNDTLYYANVGDSRIYLLKDDKLIKLSEDHTLLAMQLKEGIITESEAKKSNLSSVLTKAIGVKETVEPQFYDPIKLEGNEIILLCSDGLYNMVDERTIQRIISRRNLTVKERVSELISIANKNGGKDNITVILFDVSNLYRKASLGKRHRIIFIIIILLLLAGISLMCFFKRNVIFEFLRQVIK